MKALLPWLGLSVAFAIILSNVNGQPEEGPLAGTLVAEGDSRTDVLKHRPALSNLPTHKGEEVAKVSKQPFSPNEGLETGKLVASAPTFEEIVDDIPRDFQPPRDKIVKGSILDQNVQKGRYVPNPTKVLADLWQKGHAYPEMVSGKIVAGDAVELDVLTLPVSGLLPDLPTIPDIVPPLDAGRDMDCIDCRFRNILAYYKKADVTPEERKWFMARLTEICSCNVYRAHINGSAFLLKDTLVTVEAVRQQLNDSRFTVVYAEPKTNPKPKPGPNFCRTDSDCKQGEHCTTIGNFVASRICAPKPVDGEWSAWSEWSACSVTCGLGIQTRSRDNGEQHMENHRQCHLPPCLGGGKKDVTECCLKHGVDKSCIGECRLAQPRKLPPNFCDQFKETIAKCWAMDVPIDYPIEYPGETYDIPTTEGYDEYEPFEPPAEDVCTLPPMAGKCNAYMPMYHYDSISNQCKEFIYGGCGGNGNRFATKHECEMRCQTRNCCAALQASCLACELGISVEEYCKDHPLMLGCEKDWSCEDKPCGTICPDHKTSAWDPMYGTGVCGNNGAPWCVSVLENPCSLHSCEGKKCGDKCLMGDMEFECNAEGICDGYHHDCGLKQEGEDCGECYCPPTYNAGTCAPGLICKHDDTIPDLAGTCVKPDNSKNCVSECRDALNYWTCIMKCNEPKSRTAIGSDGNTEIVKMCNKPVTEKYLKHASLKIDPNPILLKGGARISISFGLELLKEIPVGTKASLKFINHAGDKFFCVSPSVLKSFGIDLPIDIDVGSCTYDIQKDIFEKLKDVVPDCNLGPGIDCSLPLKPGKFGMDGTGIDLPDDFKVPEEAVTFLSTWFGAPFKIGVKFFGKNGEEIICLDATLQINLE